MIIKQKIKSRAPNFYIKILPSIIVYEFNITKIIIIFYPIYLNENSYHIPLFGSYKLRDFKLIAKFHETRSSKNFFNYAIKLFNFGCINIG